MAKPYNFQIESYKVKAVQNLSENWREISLISVDLYHNIRVRATISFSTKPNGWKQWNAIGAVTNIGGLNYDGSDLLVVCDLNLFDGFYQILSTEAPVYLEFTYEDFPNEPKNLNKRVLTVELKTAIEQPGDTETVASIAKANFMPAKALALMQQLKPVAQLSH